MMPRKAMLCLWASLLIGEKKVRLSELCFLIVGAHGVSSVTYRDPAVALHATAFESLPQSSALLVGCI
jgi:hypothetical protein